MNYATKSYRQRRIKIKILSKGQYFGEQEILENLNQRKYKVDTKSEKVELLLLKREVTSQSLTLPRFVSHRPPRKRSPTYAHASTHHIKSHTPA